jgi:hypothetical protein
MNDDDQNIIMYLTVEIFLKKCTLKRSSMVHHDKPKLEAAVALVAADADLA